VKKALEKLYKRYNRREYVHPDPLEFLYEYEGTADKEIVGLVASALAYGKVKQILKSVRRVLDVLGPNPSEYLKNVRPASLRKSLKDFKHRFATGKDVTMLLNGAKKLQKEYGSLNEAFAAGMNGDGSTASAVFKFAEKLRGREMADSHIIPRPECGSACKRLHLYIKWMVRKDDVDPGGWQGVDKSKLVIPLDTHMHKLGLALGWTKRNQGDIRTAVEITEAMKEFTPNDPAKYDFALTRLGIRDDTDMDAFVRECAGEEHACPNG